MKINDFYNIIKIKYAAGFFFGSPSREVKIELKKLGWEFSYSIWNSPTILNKGGVFVITEVKCPDGKTIIDDKTTKKNYRKLCLTIAAKINIKDL